MSDEIKVVYYKFKVMTWQFPGRVVKKEHNKLLSWQPMPQLEFNG